jgi:ribosomal protein L29
MVISMVTDQIRKKYIKNLMKKMEHLKKTFKTEKISMVTGQFDKKNISS